MESKIRVGSVVCSKKTNDLFVVDDFWLQLYISNRKEFNSMFTGLKLDVSIIKRFGFYTRKRYSKEYLFPSDEFSVCAYDSPGGWMFNYEVVTYAHELQNEFLKKTGTELKLL